MVCDVCGRTLLRGENADPYLHGGERKVVCELCRGRAVNEGWIPEDESLGPRAQWGAHERRRSLLGRLRGRRERPAHLSAEEEWDPGTADWGAEEHADAAPEAGREPSPPPAATAQPPPPPTPPRRPPPPAPVVHERHVHAVPSSDEMKRARALELFNASEHPRSVAGIARSLGPPLVAVRADHQRTSIVTIVVAWELSWYRYEVDLADEANGVRIAEQGTELAELSQDDQAGNAEAGDGGTLELAAAG